METLFTKHNKLLFNTKMEHVRYLMDGVDWSDRLFAITGARGTGKTTMIFQHIKQQQEQKSLYVSLDDIYFTNNRLVHLAEQLSLNGVHHLYVDEVHKYPYDTWAQELKNIYDFYPEMHVVFSGSSILQIYKGNADLSRRAMHYELRGLSFREFLAFEGIIKLTPLSLDDILKNHLEIAADIVSQLRNEKIIPLFHQYLKLGYYPYYRENRDNYLQRVANVVNMVLESDLPAVEHIEYATVIKMKKLLGIIATLSPFTPNMTDLSNNVGLTRANLPKSLDYLERARLVGLLRDKEKLNTMSKPEKIYLDNTNVALALGGVHADTGNMRETFFYNQLKAKYKVTSTLKGDFLVDGKYVFEVGGANKTFQQIAGLPESYLAVDNTEYATRNRIPLWVFGLMY